MKPFDLARTPAAKRDSEASAAGPDYRIVSPNTFAREMIMAAERDPGCEQKAMLFYLDNGGEFRQELQFSHFESGARILSLILTAYPNPGIPPDVTNKKGDA